MHVLSNFGFYQSSIIITTVAQVPWARCLFSHSQFYSQVCAFLIFVSEHIVLPHLTRPRFMGIKATLFFLRSVPDLCLEFEVSALWEARAVCMSGSLAVCLQPMHVRSILKFYSSCIDHRPAFSSHSSQDSKICVHSFVYFDLLWFKKK